MLERYNSTIPSCSVKFLYNELCNWVQYPWCSVTHLHSDLCNWDSKHTSKTKYFCIIRNFIFVIILISTYIQVIIKPNKLIISLVGVDKLIELICWSRLVTWNERNLPELQQVLCAGSLRRDFMPSHVCPYNNETSYWSSQCLHLVQHFTRMGACHPWFYMQFNFDGKFCNSNTGHQIIRNKILHRYAVMPCAKICSDHYIKIWDSVKWDSRQS